MNIDEFYYSGIIVVDYCREYTDLILNKLINSNIDMNISIYYEKQDSYKVIKDLTYYIGNVGVDLKDKNENRSDIDIAAFSYQDAKYIRREIQVNREELYYLYIYINVYSKSENELENILNKVEAIMQSSGLITRRGNFRQEQIFKACIPICDNSIDIKEASRRNVLTSRNDCNISIYI